MATTAVFNVVTAGTAAVTGIIIARSLGPSLRGEYAAILAWFGPVHHLGQLGQGTAATFFVARNPGRAPDYLATARNMMTASGVAVLVLGILAAPLLGRGNQAMTWGYGLMFATCLPGFMGTSYLFGLQASSISRWSLVRISQPALFLILIGVLYLAGHLGLITTLLALSITFVVQAALAYELCRRRRLTRGRADLILTRVMRRYGFRRVAASLPSELTLGLDQLVLSLVVAPISLGHYAIAYSLTALAGPIVAAVGIVAFPRIASQVHSPTETARLRRHAVLLSTIAGAGLILPLACLAPWVVPAVFGPGYRDAVPLVWMLAPGGVFFACSHVCSDLLLGYGRPLTVAWGQGVACAVTIVLMIFLLPALGVGGVAVASSAGAGVAFLLMMRALSRPAAAVSDAESPPAVADLSCSPPHTPRS